MFPLILRILRSFFWDPASAQASLRSLLTFIAATAATVIASVSDAGGDINYDVLRAWTWKQWAMRIGIGAVMGYALRLKAGDKNPAPAPPGAPPAGSPS